MEGCISARDLRPITIQSGFWRLWASALLRSAAMKQWIAQAMPAEVISGCGPKAEAQIAAASVLHGVSEEGYDMAVPLILPSVMILWILVALFVFCKLPVC